MDWSTEDGHLKQKLDEEIWIMKEMVDAFISL